MAAAAELKQLGRYDLTAVLGKGAMGIVYEGMDPKLHRKVAIKTILKGHMDDDDAAKEYSMRFMREAQAVARLNHPHIVQVYDFGEEGDVAYIVMEFIKGKELKNFFDANERFELKEAVRIMCELLDALDFAHESGIVHRDIKPANVMLDAQARVKLADFGVARVSDDRSAAEKTQAGTMVGTPAYMSPEQITGGSVDRRSDIFSAGIILYQFLTGEKPFTGSGAWTIAKKIIQDHPPVPSSINNTISPLFDNVVNKALAKTVDQRYQTAKEFAIALKRALEGKSEEDESDKTVFTPPGGMPAMPSLAPAAAAARPDATGRTGSTGSQEVELEFWRAIKDGNDPDDFELYVQQFPTGIYAALAKRKIAKLKGVAPEETSAEAKAKEKKEAEEAAKREAEVRQKLADEKAKLEAQLAAKEAEYAKREKEAEARRQAEEKARAEAEAKRIAQERARAEAEAKARKEELEKARKEAETLAAQREAEYAKREAEMRAKREAEDKARREAEARAEQARQAAEAKAELARKEAERARLEAEAKAEAARREAMEKARKETEVLAKAKAEAEARAKKEAEERAKKEAEAAKREAELKKKLAEAPKAKMPIHIVAGAIIAITAVGAGGWYYYNKGNIENQRRLTEALETAAKESEALKQAQSQQQAALKKLEEARAAELAAIKAGDQAKIREAQEAAKRAEAEANKQAEAVKAREASAADARKKAQEAAEKAKQSKAPEPARTVETVTAPAPQPTQAAQPAQPAQPTVVASAPAQPAAQAPAKVEPPKAKTRSEREREEEDRLARQIAAKKNITVASASPSPTASATTTDTAPLPSSSASSAPSPAASVPAAPSVDLFAQAEAMEASDPKAAVKIYRSLARKGNGKAAKRLGEIYDKGITGIPRDYAESLQWYETARKLGETIETAGKR
jgi:serine/threonine-protein kinase